MIGAGSANRKESESAGTATAGSFPREIVAGVGLAGHWPAVSDCGTPAPGVFQASDRPVDVNVSVALGTAAVAFTGGAVELCITGSGSP